MSTDYHTETSGILTTYLQQAFTTKMYYTTAHVLYDMGEWYETVYIVSCTAKGLVTADMGGGGGGGGIFKGEVRSTTYSRETRL